MDPTTPLPDDGDRERGSHDTEAIGTADATRAVETDNPTRGYEDPRTAGDSTPYPVAPEPTRPTGTSWATVILGLVALVVGGLVLTVQTVDLDVDWSIATPAVFVGAGGLLVVLGLIALMNRRGQEEQPG